MHTVTILTLPTDTSLDIAFTSKDALSILAAFVRNFFSCEFCRVHFTEMALTIGRGAIRHDGDAVLWLWEAHNVVNKRLKDSISSDPVYPKVMFPSFKVCPFCYRYGMDGQETSDTQDKSASAKHKIHPGFNDTSFLEGESLVAAFMSKKTTAAAGKTAESARHVWNRTAVLLYLWNFYHLAGNQSKREVHRMSPPAVLRAAWPRLYDDVGRLHHKFYGLGGRGVNYRDDLGLEFNHVDMGICLMSYIMCAVFLAGITYMLIRRRRLRRLFVYP